jgi:chromosome partitioning protein
MPILGVTNQKGGVGKTLTAINLAAGLARAGKKTLLIDLDPQAPIAPSLGVTPPGDLLPIAEALKQRRAGGVVVETSDPKLFVLPGDVSIDHQALANEPLRDTVLKRALEPLRGQFDYIVCDTAPHLDLVLCNLVMVADWLILPCDADRESLQSLRRTLEVAFTYAEYRPEVDPARFYKVLVSMYDDRDRTLNSWFEEQLSRLGTPPFQTRIHRATALKRARAHSLSIFDFVERHQGHAGGERAAAEFNQLVKEVMDYEAARRDSGHRHAAAG